MAFVQVVETVDDVAVREEVGAFLVYAYPLVIDVDVRTVVEHYSLVVDLYHNHSCHAHNHCVVDYYQLVMAVDYFQPVKAVDIVAVVAVDSVTFSVQVRLIDLIPMLMVDEMELIGHFHVFSFRPAAVDDGLVEILELAVEQELFVVLELFVGLAVVSFVAEHSLYHSLVLCHMSQLVYVHFYSVELSFVLQRRRHHHPPLTMSVAHYCYYLWLL